MYPDWAAPYIGLPYVENGRSLLDGSDCFGFIRGVYEQHLGILIPIYSDYENPKDTEGIISCITEEDSRDKWLEIPIDDRKEFDIIIFKFFSLHVGIYLEGDYILHCRPMIGSCIETYFIWRNRAIGCYRHVDYKASNLSTSIHTEKV